MGCAPLLTGAFSETTISPAIGEDAEISGAPGGRAVVGVGDTLTLEEVAGVELPRSEVVTTLNVYVPAAIPAIVHEVAVVEHEYPPRSDETL